MSRCDRAVARHKLRQDRELHLQGQLTYMRTLLSQTKREPRLKGPFPVDFYNEVLLSCERMLDRLHSMRCVTTRDAWDNVSCQPTTLEGKLTPEQGIRRAFVAPVNKQRREMAGSVILYVSCSPQDMSMS